MCDLMHKRISPLLRDVIRVEGDLRLGEAVKQSHLEGFAELLGISHSTDLSELSVSDFLSYNYRTLHQCRTDVGILQEGLSCKVRTYSLNTVEQQFRVFVRILDEGGICLLAPEGDLSPDGQFWPVKSGLHRLLSMTKADVKILPVNITYDFMSRGRMRVYVTIGEEMEGLKELSKVELERLVWRSIVSLGPVTLGQLGSQYLHQRLDAGYEVVRKNEIASELFSQVQALKNSRFRLDDRLIVEHSFHKRLHDFIGYCLAKRILRKVTSSSFIVDRDRVINTADCNHWENPVQYSNNELQSLQKL